MELSGEAISAIFTGLVGVLTALAALLANRHRRISEDSRSIRRQARKLQTKHLAALEHIYVLEQILARRGVPRPARPEILEPDDEDDDGTSERAGTHARA